MPLTAWDGVFVDVIDQDEHRSHIRVVLQRAPVTATSTTPPKHQKSSQDIRDKRMKEIEDFQDLSDQISFKEKRIVACENMRDYKKMQSTEGRSNSLKKQRHKLESELKGINC